MDLIEQRERDVEVRVAERLCGKREGVVAGPRLAGPAGEVAQGLDTPLRQHLARHFGYGMEQTADAAGFVRDRTEREREPRLLEKAVAIEEHPHLLEIAALAQPR